METIDGYFQKRLDLMSKMQSQKYSDVSFTDGDEEANKIFKIMIESQRKNLPASFYRGNTLKNKELIDGSDLFKIVQKMPKGAVLHLHVDCAIDEEQFLDFCLNDNVYVDKETNNLSYRKTPPPDPKWISFKNKRALFGDNQKFDSEFKNSLTIGPETTENLNGKTVWDLFMDRIIKTNPVLFYRENYYNYLVLVCKGFIQEGVNHLEVRALLGSVLDEEGKALSAHDELQVYRLAVHEVQKTHPEFTFKIICQGLKMWDLEQIDNYMKHVIKLKKRYPDLIVGFDLVQEEDKFNSIEYLSKVLIRKEEYEKEEGVELPFVLHGGESLNLSTESLFDLILLKTKRIGHGLNLIKHSYLMDIIKEKKIALEVCPFSNQLLGYVEDLRLHPIISYHNYGLRVTINPDDPGFFRSRYINYDYYLCAVALEFDLKDFKKIIINSIEASLLESQDKKKQLEYFDKKWNRFIDELLRAYRNNNNRKSMIGD